MEKNKTGRYIKYAIGEIILVVIGILLALAINNWNNQRQLKNNNKVFLIKMLNDLDANEKRLNRLIYKGFDIKYDIPSFEEAIKACDSILNLTYTELNETHLDYIISGRFSAQNSLLNLNKNTYSELINSGKLYTVGSDTLVMAIATYYQICERETEYNLSNNKLVDDGFIKFEDGFGKLMLDYQMDSLNFNINNYPFYSDKNSKEYKDFQIGIAGIGSGQNQNKIKMAQLIIRTNNLKELIKNELQIN
jgi:hypothetical protein